MTKKQHFVILETRAYSFQCESMKQAEFVSSRPNLIPGVQMDIVTKTLTCEETGEEIQL